MAHYAFLDENNIVVEVITGRNEDEVVDGISDWETYYGNRRGLVCKQYSYNNNPPRGRAGIGFTYDPALDRFFPNCEFASWKWNKKTLVWEAPVAKPNDGKWYLWNEDTLSWDWMKDYVPPVE